MSAEVLKYIKDQQSNSLADLSPEWNEIEDLYTKRLWHQLTLRVQQIVKHPMYTQGNQLIEMYSKFLCDFESKINYLSLVEIVCPYIIRQYTDATEALAFLEKIKDKVKTTDEAVVLCSTAIGSVHLLNKSYPETKKIIEETESLLNSLPGVTSVHARFYELCSNYHQMLGNHNDYYKDALRYLGCANIEDIPVSEQQERAFNLGLAGLLGKDVFNFGELLQHPVLESLKGTERSWLVDLLFAFNSGNMSEMMRLKQFWGNQPDLAANELQMRQKIMLLCLMEMTFSRPANDRHLTFSEIAEGTGLAAGEVEILIMKAMSLGLVKGTINQVIEKVHMTWVQPRVLDKVQIGKMKEKLDHWCKEVHNMENVVEDKAQDILT